MPVYSQQMPSAAIPSGVAPAQPGRGRRVALLRKILLIVTLILAQLAIVLGGSQALAWGGQWLDNLRYGTPRAFHLDAVVGHADGQGTPTHLIGMNLNRQVIVVELPGGDANKARALYGPYLIGAGEDRTPILLRTEDSNRDGALDLVVNIKNEEVVYLNKDGQFQLITAEERLQLPPGP